MSEIIQSVLFHKNKYSKNEAVDWLIKHNYKHDDIDESKPHYIHFRQIDPKPLEKNGYLFKIKHEGPDILFVIAYKLEGGAISATNIDKFIKSSYDRSLNEDIDGYKKDSSLSNDEVVCFFNSSTGHAVAVFRGTEPSLTDWSNNVQYVVGNYENTKRFKRAKESYKKIVDKYGEKNISLVGHSQSAVITRKIGANAKEIINVNPAHLFEKQKDNEFNVRSSKDVVSALKPVANVVNKTVSSVSNAIGSVFGKKKKKEKDTSKQNITIEADTSNPLTEHSSEILGRLDGETMIGQGRVVLDKNYKKFNTVEIELPLFLHLTKKNNVVEVKPITQKGAITSRDGKKSVKFSISPDNEVHIINNGETVNKLDLLKELEEIIEHIPQKEINEIKKVEYTLKKAPNVALLIERMKEIRGTELPKMKAKIQKLKIDDQFKNLLMANLINRRTKTIKESLSKDVVKKPKATKQHKIDILQNEYNEILKGLESGSLRDTNANDYKFGNRLVAIQGLIYDLEKKK